jgi:hypothetical protein
MSALLFSFLIACSTAQPPGGSTIPEVATPGSPGVPAQPPAPRPAPLQPDNGDTPIACGSDADCPHLACGPCTAGQPVTHLVATVSCTVNPCPGQVAVCSPAHVCVARDTIPMITR